MIRSTTQKVRLESRNIFTAMIGWLKEMSSIVTRRARSLVLIACGGVGYDVQLIQRDWQAISTGQLHEFWVHQVVVLTAFSCLDSDMAERDLFRELIK